MKQSPHKIFRQACLMLCAAVGVGVTSATAGIDSNRYIRTVILQVQPLGTLAKINLQTVTPRELQA